MYDRVNRRSPSRENPRAYPSNRTLIYGNEIPAEYSGECMKRVATLEQLRMEYARIHSCATDTDRWLCEAFMFLIDNGFGQPKPKRKPSAYNVFFGKGVRTGLTATEIAAKWRAKKQ